jgi:hypothetical protein
VTYCFAYQFRDNVFLFADTVVEMAAASSGSLRTSYGQLFDARPGSTLRETAVKLHSIGSDCAVAIAGDANRAMAAIDSLRANYSHSVGIAHLLQQLSVSIAQTKESPFEFLVARNSATGPELWYWSSDSRSPQQCDRDGLWTIGSPHDVVDFEVWRIMRTLRRSDISEHEMLILMTAAFQAAFLRHLTVASGSPIGGVVLSLRLDSIGTHWTPDINYFVHSGGAQPAEVIQLRYRDGGFGVASPHLDAIHLCVTGRSAYAWRDIWAQTIVESMFHQLAEVWVFLNASGHGAIVVHNEQPFNKCDLFDGTFEARRVEGFGLESCLYELLPEISEIDDPPQLVHSHISQARAVCLEVLRRLRDPVKRDALLKSQRVRSEP